VKSIIEVPRTRGNSVGQCWNQPNAATPFTKLCAIMSTRSLFSQVRGHQISVNRLRNAGESCNIRNEKQHCMQWLQIVSKKGYKSMCARTHTHTNTHTHTHTAVSWSTRILSGTTQVSRHQKGKTNLHLLKQESEWQWHQLGHMQICTLTQTQRRQHPTTHFFYRPDALPAAQPTVSKHRWWYAAQQVLINSDKLHAKAKKRQN